MSNSRPYLKHSVADLRAQAQVHREDPIRLQSITQELALRPYSAAALLLQEIKSWEIIEPTSRAARPSAEKERSRAGAGNGQEQKEHWRGQGAHYERTSQQPLDDVTRLLLILAEERKAKEKAQQDAERFRSQIESLKASKATSDEILHLRRQLEQEQSKSRAAKLEANSLRDQLDAAKKQRGGNSVYAKVFLTQDIPTILLVPLSKVFKKHLHPDQAKDLDSTTSTRRFQEMQSAFEVIARERNIRLS